MLDFCSRLGKFVEDFVSQTVQSQNFCENCVKANGKYDVYIYKRSSH